MNVLYLDLEHGSQTLGSEKAIEDMFSFPVLSPSTWKQFQSLIGQLYTTKTTSTAYSNFLTKLLQYKIFQTFLEKFDYTYYKIYSVLTY